MHMLLGLRCDFYVPAAEDFVHLLHALILLQKGCRYNAVTLLCCPGVNEEYRYCRDLPFQRRAWDNQCVCGEPKPCVTVESLQGKTFLILSFQSSSFSLASYHPAAFSAQKCRLPQPSPLPARLYSSSVLKKLQGLQESTKYHCGYFLMVNS